MNKPHLPIGHLCQPATREGQPRLAWVLPQSSILALVLLVHLAAAPCARSASATWDADPGTTGAQDGGGVWSLAASNWWNGTADNGWNNGDSAIFGSGSGAAGSVLITNAGITVSGITFNAAGSANYTVTASGGNILTLVGSPTLTANADATLSLVVSGNGFTKEGSGKLSLNPVPNNNTFTNTTTVNSGTLALAAGADNVVQVSSTNILINPGATLLYSTAGPVPGAANLTVNGGTLTNANATGGKTLTLNRLTLEGNGLVVGTFSQASLFVTNYDVRSGTMLMPRLANNAANIFPLIKSTAGTATVDTGSQSAASQGFIVTVNAGTLIMEYLNPGPNGDTGTRAKYGAGALTLGGGTIRHLYPASASGGRTESGITGTTVRPGATALVITNNHVSSGYTLAMAGITRNAGGTVDFTKVTAGGAANFTTTTANGNGILGGWATFSGTDWALGSPVAAATASYQTNNNPAQWTATTNISLNLSPSATLDDTTIYSLRLTNGPTVTINATKTLTLASGGLLVVGSSPTTITGGSLAGASGQDLIVQQYSSADLTISSDLTNNTTATSLTKSGPGKLVLTGVNNMTGTNFLNGGIVEVGDLAKLAGGPLVMNAGTLRYTGTDTTDSRALIMNGVGGTFEVAAGTSLTLSGAIRGSGAVLGDLGGLTKTGNGTLALTASNYYNGATVVSAGTLLVNGTNAYDSTVFAAGNVNVNGGTVGGFGTIGGSVAVKSGATLAPGASIGTLTLATNLTLEAGSTSLFEVSNAPGASDKVIVQGNLTVSNSTVAIKVVGTDLTPGTYPLFQYSGKLTGSFNPAVAVVGGSVDGSPTIDTSTSGQVNLVVSPQVAITSQPVDTIVSVGADATFNVSATGTAPIGYQWYFYGNNTNNTPTPISYGTTNSLTITNAQTTNSGFYSVVITNNYGPAVTSRIATLIVGDVAPVISGPVNQTVIAGNNVTFSTSVVIANPQPTFQWQTNDVDVTGATTSSLTLNNVPYALDGAKVSVIASNVAGLATNSATLTVIVTPFIIPVPTNLVVNVGDAAVFYSGATGVPTPLLQWYKDSVALAGETGGTLTITSAQGSNIGNYSLVASNVAGVATSSSARLTVRSTTLATTTLAPTNGATGVCYDTPLYITFNSAVTTVTNGRVLIYNLTNPATPVDTLDMSLNNALGVQSRGLFPGDSQAFNYFPVIVSGSTAAIYPHPGVLTSNQTYYVTLEAGVVADSAGAYFAGISATNTWQFSTKPTGPANPTNLVVAADGSGDFVTVQGAVDSIPLNNTNYTLINIRDGNYLGLVNISSKHNVTFRGQSRTGTVIGYPNNNNLNGTTHARMAFKVNGNDIALENLTVLNSTPQGGSQAEALMIEGNSVVTAAKRCIVNNADIVSRQDTILANINASQGYFYDTTVRGNFDYIWGGGNLFFAKCTIHTLTNTGSSSYNLTAARTDFGTTSATGNWQTPDGTKWSSNGLSFVECTLGADPGVGNITLAGANGQPGGLASWAFCRIDTNAYVAPPSSLTNTYNFWQFGNTDTNGNPISFLGLQTLTNGDPRLLAATNASVWLYGWTPKLAPNILANPANQSVAGGGTVSLNVAATGIPTPAYQWLRNGIPLDGQTNATLTIANAHAGQAGTYSVIVSNVAGAVTSGGATVTVGNTAPTLGVISDQTVNVGVTVSINVAALASDPDVPPQALTFSRTSGPANATIDPGTGAFSFRPLVSQAGATYPITLSVADDGVGNLSASQSFSVIVNPLTQPDISSPVWTGGQFSLSVNGQSGPDYAVQASTNLTDWQSVFTTNSPAMPFQWADPDTGTLPMRFYRIVVGPPLP